MKRFFFAAFITGAFVSAPATAQSSLDAGLRAEQAIGEQLRIELAAILPARSFAVFPSVTVRIVPRRELEHAESVVRDDGDDRNATPDLPGFEAAQSHTADGPSRSERQTYRVVRDEEVERVSVRVVLDEGLPRAVADAAKSAVTFRLNGSFGPKATATFQLAPLLAMTATANGNGSGELAIIPAFIRENLATILAVALGLAALLGLARRFLVRRPTPSHATSQLDSIDVTAQPMPQPFSLASDPSGGMRLPPGVFPRHMLMAGNQNWHGSPGHAEAEADAERARIAARKPDLEEAVQRFVEELGAEPLKARKFLSNLEVKTKGELERCFHFSPTRDLLKALMGATPPEIGAEAFPNLTDEALRVAQTALILRMTQELHQYRRLSQLPGEARFGMLGLLNGEEMTELLRGRAPRAIAAILSHLEPKTAQAAMRDLEETDRRAVFSELAKPLGFTTHELDEVNAALIADVEGLARDIFVPKSGAARLMDLIMEESGDARSLIGAIGRERPDLVERYRLHVASLDDFLGAAPELVTEGLDGIGNETIARALKTLSADLRLRLMSALPEIRRSVISALEVSLARDDQGEGALARQELVRRFRTVAAQRGATA